MSYRVTVNGVQLFGNNEEYAIWDDFIRSQGIAIGEDGNYDGEIKDFHGAMLACEAIAMDLARERKEDAAKILPGMTRALEANPDDEPLRRRIADESRSLFDFSGHERYIEEKIQSLFDTCYEIATTGYVFLPFALYLACRDLLDDPQPAMDPDGTFRIRTYRFKPGMTARVHAG